MRLVALAAALLLPVAANASHPLRSPWDGKDVKMTDAPYSCPAIIHLSPDLTTDRFYADAKSSIIDPVKWQAYVASSGPYKALGQRVVDAADAFRTTGSREAVDCAVRHMDAAAHDDVFKGKMSSNQAYYMQGWVIGAIAIADLKIRDSRLISPEQEHQILTWIVDVVHQTMNYYDARRQKEASDAENNHLYWAGVEVSAAGIAANDRRLFDWGIEAYRIGIAQIQPDGSLPLEMKRGQRALHYHLYALAPLVYLAEFGQDNGLDLYAERDYALKKLVAISTQGMLNPGYFERTTGIVQDTPKGPPTAEQISWAKLYVARFSDQTLSKLITMALSTSYMYLGGLPPE